MARPKLEIGEKAKIKCANHSFIMSNKIMKISIPPHIVKELELKKGECPVWRSAQYQRNKSKIVKVTITRGESLFADD